MRLIVGSQEHFQKLLGKQPIKRSMRYRLMRYVLIVKCDERILLLNVVTGQVVLLNEVEVELLQSLPVKYSSLIESLVRDYYLVPQDFDEHRMVFNLRKVLKSLNEAQKSKMINHYTILPTTACNARCYYCFERGTKFFTMTEKTANDVVDFIYSHSDRGSRILLSWFGGEPTVASHRIDQICEGLKAREIEYLSDMTTNGYLLQEKMINQAVNLWNLKSVMICVDGTEASYNKTKAFAGVSGSPYQQVMDNINLLLERKIYVELRMNFDLGNYKEFEGVIENVKNLFGQNPYLKVTAHPIVGCYMDSDGIIKHADDDWFENKVLELNDLSRENGLYPPIEQVSCLHFSGCEATTDTAVVITPEGKLAKCPEQFDESQVIGNLEDGITNQSLVESWKNFEDYQKCVDCVLYPRCEKISNCRVENLCHFRLELIQREKNAVREIFLMEQ